MNIWPAETSLLFRSSFCMLPLLVGFLKAEGLARQNRMGKAARLWSVAVGVVIFQTIMFFLAGLVLWMLLDRGSVLN